MSEAELILLDIAIAKFPRNTPFNFQGVLHQNVLMGMSEKYTPEVYKELAEIVTHRPLAIRQLMLQFDYIKCVDHRYPKDELIDVGKKAQELGGHQQYLAWKEKEDKQKRFEEFPKKKWHIYDIAKILVPIIIVSLLSYLKGGYDERRKLQPNSQLDTLQKGQLKSQKDTAQSSPRISDTLDKIKEQP